MALNKPRRIKLRDGVDTCPSCRKLLILPMRVDGAVRYTTATAGQW